VRATFLLTIALAVTLAVAAPAAGGGARFATYVSCSATTADRDTTCSLGASPVAIFRALRKRDVDYRVCVRRPSGERRCREKRSGRVGHRSQAPILLGAPGGYRVSWLVGGRRVDRDRFRARAPRVFVNGDSLAVGTKPYLPRVLPGWPITQSTSISRHVPEGVGILRAMGGGLARIVVMQLGTNDDPRTDEDFHHSVRATMRIVGSHRCVVWPNIVRPRVAGTSYAGYNHALAVETRRHDNLFVVDWVAIARRHPYWFGADGVHPNAEGYEARARAIAKKVRRCLE
jgi:hypothetical protein